MPRTVMVPVSVEFLTDLFKRDRSFSVVNPLPADSKLIGMIYKESRFEFTFQSDLLEEHEIHSQPIRIIRLEEGEWRSG